MVQPGEDARFERKRVFISHSSTTDALGDHVRRLVSNGLADRGFEVLLDEELLIAGDEWRATLYRWLGICEAAVLLFNRAAIERPDWVRFEASVVGIRHAWDQDVDVVPVLIGDVQASDLDDLGLGPAHLTAIQCASTDATGPTEAVAQDLARQVLTRFNRIDPRRSLTSSSRRDPMSLWIRTVKQHIADHPFLPEIADELGIVDDWPPDDPDLQAELVAYRLLYVGTNEVGGVFDRWLVRSPEFRLHGGEFLDNVVPSWVDPASARRLWSATIRPPGRRIVALSANEDRTLVDYIRRASCCGTSSRIVGASSPNLTTEGGAWEIVEGWIRPELIQTIGTSTSDPTAEEIEQGFQLLEHRGTRLFGIIGRSILESEDSIEETLRPLFEDFDQATFVLNDRGAQDDPRVQSLISERVVPDPDPRTEDEVRMVERQLRSTID